MHGGKFTWTYNGSSYSEELNDTTPSKIAAADARAATALSTTVANIVRLDKKGVKREAKNAIS